VSSELWLRRPIAPSDVAALCARVRALALLSSSDGVLVCDVRAIGDPGLATVDALARVQLTAARLGRRTVLFNVSPELRQLLDLAGLSDALPSAAAQDGGVAGNPKRGNRVSVSRKNANSTIRPSDTSSTWSAHGS